MRKQKQAANVITVFARTSPFKDDFYSNSATLEMPVATNNTVELLRASSRLIECIYRQGESFKKGGVILTGLVDECVSQTNLFDRISDEERERSLNLMQVMDNLNSKFGRDALKFASAGVKQIWKTKSEMRSPRYTTCWEELLLVS